jgi:hypothetical protein
MIKVQDDEMDGTTNNMSKMGYRKVSQPGNLKRSGLVGYLAVVRSGI